MKSNMLKLNEEKTEFLVIHSTRQNLDLDTLTLKVGDACVPCSRKARNLGVIFNEHMSMEPHVRSVCRSAKYHLRNISKIRPFLDHSATERVIHAFISCRLDTANSLLIGSPKYLVSMLQGVQNSAVRLLFRAPKYLHVSHLLKETHWLPVHSRIEYKVMLLTYKALNGAGPSYLRNLLTFYEPTRTLRSQNACMLIKPKILCESFGGRTFSRGGPKLWNSLPLELKNTPNIDNFKKGLKTYLFLQNM